MKKKPARERAGNGDGRNRRLDELEAGVSNVLRQFPPGRIRKEDLSRDLDEDQSRDIAEYLLAWKDCWDRWVRGQAGASMPFGLLRESGLVAKIVLAIEEKEKRKIVGYDNRLREAIKSARGRLRNAEEQDRRARRRNSSFQTLCRHGWNLATARLQLGNLVTEFNVRRSGADRVSSKRPLPRAYLLGPLLRRLFARGFPDRGISKLLQLVHLGPPVSERQIKRIRLSEPRITFRRP